MLTQKQNKKTFFMTLLLLFSGRLEHSPCNRNVSGSISGHRHSWGNLVCALSHCELKIGVAPHFGKRSPWSSANKKGIDSLIAWLIPTIGLYDLLTY